MSFFWVRAVCEIWLASYGFKHTYQSHFDTPFVHASHINYRSYVDVLHIEQLLYYQKHSLCVLELHERSDWRTMTPNTHWSVTDTTLCAYTASLYIYHYLVYNYAWQQNSHTLWLYYTPDKTLLPTMHHFIKTSLASYSIHVAVSFQLQQERWYKDICINNKINKKYYSSSW